MSTIKLRLKPVDDGLLVRVLLTHPMDTGRKIDSSTGQTIPAHYIRSLKLTCNGQVVAECDLSTAVSKDPYFAFKLLTARPGDRIGVDWVDNLGLSDSAEVIVQ